MILNKTADEMLNEPFASIFIEYEENDDFNQIIIDAIGDYNNPHEKVVQYFNGENIKYLHIKSSSLRESGEKTGILILMDDITELMKLRGLELDLKRIKEINEQLEIRNIQLKKEAETDKLTGLLNKKAMENLCADYLKNLTENDSAAFYMIDLDHFKEANDTYGHQCGDMILQMFANFLREIFNENAYIGRFGGDEFSILLKNPSDEKFIESKARAILKAAIDILVDDMKIQITASVGVVIIKSAVEYQKAFALADEALYFVKENGRNNFHTVGSSN
jgi:diguanylate cyclase (GGDEF)-like protein